MFVTLFTVAGAAPGYADSDPLERPSPTATAESPQPRIAELSPAEREGLAQLGVDGNVTVQTDAKGASFYLDDQGDWVLELPTEKNQSESRAWNLTGCVGSFFGPQKVNNTLEWGGSNTCTSTTSLFKHEVRMTLRDTCVGPFCITTDTLWTAVSPRSAQYSRVASAVRAANCVDDDDRSYSQVARVTVRSTQFGPFVSNSVVITDCHVHPAAGGVG